MLGTKEGKKIKSHDKGLYLLKSSGVQDEGFHQEGSSNWVMKNENIVCTYDANQNSLLKYGEW